MNKILFVATVFKHFRAFHLPYIEWFKQQGWQVDVMANGDDPLDNVHHSYNVPVSRSPFSISNIKAIRQAKKIINREKYDIVYCHTAMGAVLARLASKGARKRLGTKVIYVAHGFHFFKGSPRKYWLMYYPMEKHLSRFTDAIVTINQEDYDLVKTHGFKNQQTYKIPGIGMNTERLSLVDESKKIELREQFGYKKDDFILLYIAEYIPRKNHKFLVESMPKLIEQIPSIRLLFAGRGQLMEETKSYAKALGVDGHIDFLGFRKDIGNVINISDVGVSASRQEGLGLNLAEEMFSGIPVVATVDRGHKEMIIDGENGFMFPQNDHDGFIQKVVYMYNNPEERKRMGKRAYEIIQKFKLENSLKEMEKVFYNYFPD